MPKKSWDRILEIGYHISVQRLSRILFESLDKIYSHEITFLFNCLIYLQQIAKQQLVVQLCNHFWTYREHCMKSVRICCSSGPYSVQMRENTDEKDPEYGLFYSVKVIDLTRRMLLFYFPFLITTCRGSSSHLFYIVAVRQSFSKFPGKRVIYIYSAKINPSIFWK